MAATATATIARSILTVRSSYIHISKRLLSSSSSIAKAPPLPGVFRPAARSMTSISHSLRVVSPGAYRLNTIRCRVNRSGGTYLPLNSSSNFSDRPPTEMAPLFPGCDYEHWLIVMDKPNPDTTKQEMIDTYIKTLAKVLGRYSL